MVPGVYVAAAFVVIAADNVTVTLVAVPALIYPAVTTGVTDIDFDNVNIFVPGVTTAELPEIVVGAFAVPEVIVTVTASG